MLMTKRDAQLLIINFIPKFMSALHVSNETSRSSSGEQHNALYYTVQSVQSCYKASLSALKAARLA